MVRVGFRKKRNTVAIGETNTICKDWLTTERSSGRLTTPHTPKHSTMKGCLTVSLLITIFVVFVAGQQTSKMQIQSFLRPGTASANTHVLYDDTQILVVDVGKEEVDTEAPIAWLQKMTAGGQRTINAFFITHGHPDHCMALWRMQQV